MGFFGKGGGWDLELACGEGLGLDHNPLVLVGNRVAQSGTNNVSEPHTEHVIHSHTDDEDSV